MKTEKFLTQSLISFAMAICLSSCSSNEKMIPNDSFISPVPISEVQERVRLPLEATIEKLTRILEGQHFKIPGGFTSDNRFSTSALKISDKMCQGQYLKNAPLPCEIKIHGTLIESSPSITYVRILYQESCMGQHHINTNCKDSKGEKLLFSILKELKE